MDIEDDLPQQGVISVQALDIGQFSDEVPKYVQRLAPAAGSMLEYGCPLDGIGARLVPGQNRLESRLIVPFEVIGQLVIAIAEGQKPLVGRGFRNELRRVVIRWE